MLTPITNGVWAHTSKFLQSNAVVVQGDNGVLLIDPGITNKEVAELAADIKELGQPIVAGFSTHPHWDHLLWDTKLGDATRYGTRRGLKEIDDFLANPDWKTAIAPLLPADIASQIPINENFGKIKALPAGSATLPWDGPKVRVIEHAGHAAGSATLLIEDFGVLVAGDMLSDVLIPFFEFDAADPAGDYVAALDMFESLADSVKYFIPGHGSVGDVTEMRARIKQDRAYVEALRDGGEPNDPRLATSPNSDVHPWQVQQIAEKSKA